jgi:hypothetical protein
MEAHEFKVGVRFTYIEDVYPSEKNIVQTVIKIEDGLIYTDLNYIIDKCFSFDSTFYLKNCIYVGSKNYYDLIENIFNIFCLKENQSLTNDEIRTKIEKELSMAYSIGFKDGENTLKNQLKEKLKGFID